MLAIRTGGGAQYYKVKLTFVSVVAQTPTAKTDS